MYRDVDLYAKVRRAVMVEGISEREAAKQFGIDRKTVSKMIRHSVPPGYQRKDPPVSPKLGPFVGVVNQILLDDRDVLKKQRHTAVRIFERLRDEHAYQGGYTVVREFVAKERLRQQEVFVPLAHPPGRAQVDFGEADIYLGGVKTRIHYFCLDLPHSDAIFVKAYPAETTEAFLDGHVTAFTWLGGVPQSVLYDNTKIAVAKILGDGRRTRTKAFAELQSHYLFEDRFGRPAKGNDKGKVEGLVGYARRNFMVPLPRVRTIDELNARLLAACEKRKVAVLRGKKESIGERLIRDRQTLMPLPTDVFDPCEKVSTRVSSLSLVRYRSNDYSVPTAYGHHDVFVRGYVDSVVIASGSEVIARHSRCYAKEEFIYNPLHYLALLERKPNALDQAAPLQHWDLPEEFERLRRQLEARLGKKGRKEYIQVLRLIETFGDVEVAVAVEDALRLSAISYDAVKHLILARIERRAPRLNLSNYPFLPQATVGITDVRDYLALLQIRINQGPMGVSP
jgi:transposase